MPRRFLQRYMPKPDTLRRQRSLRFIAPLIAGPRVMAFNTSKRCKRIQRGAFLRHAAYTVSNGSCGTGSKI